MIFYRIEKNVKNRVFSFHGCVVRCVIMCVKETDVSFVSFVVTRGFLRKIHGFINEVK